MNLIINTRPDLLLNHKIEMQELKHLTTKEVARLCRVSDATVKRWEDAGLLQSERTNGGHRRFRAEEVARFQKNQGLGLKCAHGDQSAARAQTRRRENRSHSSSSLFHSLVAGAEEEAANILITSHLHGKPLTEIFDDLISSAMSRVGELWYKGELSIAQEHLATRAVHNAIHKLRHTLPIPEMSGELAMCCGIEGDFHELPPHLAQIIMENKGWEVMNFGANTPLYALAEEVLQHSPEVICVSATVMTDIERTSRDYKSFRETIAKLKIPVIIGGRALHDDRIRQRFPAELYATSFADVSNFLNDLIERK